MSSPSTAGRGGGRGRGSPGRGGRNSNQARGRGSSRNGNGRPSVSPTKFKGNCSELGGHIFDCSDYKQADIYTTTVKRIADYVGSEYKHGGDIRSTITTGILAKIKIPICPVIVDPNNETLEEQTLKMIFKGQIGNYIKQKSILDDNIQKAYALVLGQCTELLRSKLKQQPKWEEVESQQDVLRLLGLIRAITFKFEDQKYLPLALLESKLQVYNLRQNKMSCHEYLEKFQNLVAIAVSYKGRMHDLALCIFVIDQDREGKYSDARNNGKTNEEVLTLARDDAEEMCLATMFIAQADKQRFGKLQEELANDYTKGNDNYPKNLVAAYMLLSEYKNWQPRAHVPETQSVAFVNEDKKKKNSSGSNDDWKKKATCHNCGKVGHIKPECPNKAVEDDDEDDGDKKPPASVLKKKSTADKKKKKKATTFAQDDTDDDSDADSLASSRSGKSGFGFCNTDSKNNKKLNLRECILLDSQSTTDLFCNRKLVKDQEVWETNTSMTVSGNGGDLTTTKKAYIKNYGEVWFDERAITNILSLKNVKKQFRVTLDTEDDAGGALVVHKPDGTKLLFVMHDNGLHYHHTKNRQMTLVNTVKKNAEGYSKRQVEAAKRAREFQSTVGHPSTADLKNIIKANLIANCPVSPDDVERAEKIFGPSVPILKGKTTRTTPDAVVAEYIAVPRSILAANQQVTLCMDLFFVNKVPFFHTLSDHLKFTTVAHLPNRKIVSVIKAFDQTNAIYTGRGFKIKTVFADPEFTPAKFELLDREVALDVAQAGAHIPRIERNTKFVKERVRATRHTLPFKRIPLVMLVELVFCCVLWINAFPRKGGVSDTTSPRQIMTGVQFDYAKHCKCPFGAYVQAYTNPKTTNTPDARTVGAICLGPVGNLQGSYKFMNLRTGKIFKPTKWTVLPMPQEVIDRVNQLGAADGQPELLTFFDRKGELIGDDAEITGVPDDAGEEPEYRAVHDPNVATGVEMETPLVETVEENDDDGFEIENPSEVHENDVNLDPENDDPEDNDDGVMAPLDPEPDNAIAGQPVEVETVDEEAADEIPGVRRSTRAKAKPPRLVMSHKGQKYAETSAVNVEDCIPPEFHDDPDYTLVAHLIMTQLSMKAGLKKWGEQASGGVTEELAQLHYRDTFEPVDAKKMSKQEFKEALESHLFLKQKRDGKVKGRVVAGGNRQRDYISKEEATSPTVKLESVLLSAIIDAKEGRDVATVDIPNAFVQTRLEDDKDKAIIRFRGALADYMIAVAPDFYGPYAIKDSKGETILYVRILNALYGIMKAALLYYEKFVKDITAKGFVINPYDPCVANKMVNGKQLTILWHVDDLKISHVHYLVVTDCCKWLKKKYEQLFEDGSGAMKIVRGKIHEYLGMTLDYSVRGEVKVTMIPYIKDIVEKFTKHHDDSEKVAVTPASEHLFTVDEKATRLSVDMSIVFHNFVAKCLFATKRARPDISTAIAFLTTRVKSPDEDDWKKLVRLIRYLRGTPEMPLILKADDVAVIKWWVDGAHGVHPNMRGHTGGCVSLGFGCPITGSNKQKLNTGSSTETELVGVSDWLPMIVWTNYFMQAQGYETHDSIVYQDNQSAMLLEKNGMKSSGKRTRHINIRYFLVTDRINNKEFKVEYCPTTEMIADYFTKPLQGKLFIKFRKYIMNLP